LGAAVLLSDDFSYPNGFLITTSGGLWNNHNGTSGQVQVNAGRVLLTEDDLEDVNAAFTPNGNTLYVSLSVRFTGLPGSSGTYFCHFKDSSFGYRPKIFATTTGAGAGRFRLGISEASNTPNQIFPQDLFLNTDYKVVFRYRKDTGQGTLWLDPSSAGDLSVSTTESPSLITVTAFALRQSSANNGMGDLQVDDLLVGTEFSDVVSGNQAPTITVQPEDQFGFVGDTVDIVAVASGAPPLSYQWNKNGAAVLGGTNATLTLSNLTFADVGDYSLSISNAFGSTNSEAAALTVAPPDASLTLLNYNVKGNNAPDWSTNSAQVRAIGRQMQYLDPDIITFQEIPLDFTYEMTNFVKAFRPGFHLADDSGTDGWIRSVILSRYPINRDRSWLDGVSLVPFGFNGTFTRDLYEAEIDVPGYPDPLHVFTVHHKAGQDTTSSSRRGAEANAISNFFVTGFLTTNSHRPYLLAGDMNEDINNPPASNPQSIQTLTSTPTGLRLTTPVNPFSGSRNTISIQGTLNRRYDYIMPGGLLFSNILSSQIFRTDLIPGPPAPLFSTDSVTASDHLPVVMEFLNPYGLPFRILSISSSNTTASITWESVPGAVYQVEAQAPGGSWTVQASNIVAGAATLTYPIPATNEARLYRVGQQAP
jgi:endonuclease/exonuclease/phosphatase family metal-dependent hydrolase